MGFTLIKHHTISVIKPFPYALAQPVSIFFLLSQPKELHGNLCIFVFEGVFLSFKSLFLTVSARGSTYRITHQASFFPHGSNVPLA